MTTATANRTLDDLYEWAREQSKIGVATLLVRQYEAGNVSPTVVSNATRVRDRQIADGILAATAAPKANPWPGDYTVETPHRHYTFRVAIQASDDEFAPGATVVKYLSGRDNTSDYTMFAIIRDGRLIVFKKFRQSDELLAAANQFLADPDAALKSKRCARCGRKLTTPESVGQGFGPECVEMGLR